MKIGLLKFILFGFVIISSCLAERCLLKNSLIDKLWFFTYSTGLVLNDSLNPTNFITLQTDGN